MRWQLEITRELVTELQHRLEWALQRANKRAARSFGLEWSIGRRQRILAAIALAGLGIIGLLFYCFPEELRRHPFKAGLAVSLFVAALVAVPFLGRVRSWGMRAIGGVFAWQAALTYRRAARRAPYTIEYELADDRLDVRNPAVGGPYTLHLRAAGYAMYAPGVVFVFYHARSLSPFSYIYTPSATEQAAVLAAFERCGVRTEQLDGPTDGYGPPVPEARIHRG